MGSGVGGGAAPCIVGFLVSLTSLSVTGCQYPRLPMVVTIDVSRNQPTDSGIKGPQCRVPSVPYRLNTVVGSQPSPALFFPNGFSWLWVTWHKRPLSVLPCILCGLWFLPRVSAPVHICSRYLTFESSIRFLYSRNLCLRLLLALPRVPSPTALSLISSPSSIRETLLMLSN